MKYYQSSFEKGELRIKGVPDAVAVIAVEGKESKRLADLALHKTDLEFAKSCLHAINTAPEEPKEIRQALWRSTILHFYKCFGQGARFQLSSKKIYKNEPAEAIDVFNHYKELRNRHYVHDENSYAQCIPGAVLNNGKKEYKIEEIICYQAFGETLDEIGFTNMNLLISRALKWVIAEFDSLADKIRLNLENNSYSELINKKKLSYTVPTAENIAKRR